MQNELVSLKPSDDASTIQVSHLSCETVRLNGNKWEEIQPILPHILEWKMNWLQISKIYLYLEYPKGNLYKPIEHIKFSLLQVIELN